MFLYPQNENQDPKKNEIDWSFFLAFLTLPAAAIVYKYLPLLRYWYFRYYEWLYFSLYGLACAGLVTALVLWLKKTKAVTERYALLSQASSERGDLFVGQTRDGADLYLPEVDRCGHVQILGATGRGKTESVILPWVCQDIVKGRNVVLIDGKGDPSLLKNIRQAAEKSRYKPDVFVFDLGNPNASCLINPVASGSPQQITDRIFTAFTFEDPYYRSVQLDVTLSIVQLIQESPGVNIVTFKRLYELLTDDQALAKAVSQSSNNVLKRKLVRFLSLAAPDRAEKLSGLLSQIAPFAVGEVAHLVNAPLLPEKQTWSVTDSLIGSRSKQSVFVVLIPTLKYQQIGFQLGKLLLQELGWAVGQRASLGTEACFTPVYLDECVPRTPQQQAAA